MATNYEICDKALTLYNNGKYEQAYNLAIKLAQKEYRIAQYLIGEMYYFGRGVVEDDEQAIYWHMKAAEQGDLSAKLRLGDIYFNGENVERDYEKAEYWYAQVYSQDDDGYGDYALKMLNIIEAGGSCWFEEIKEIEDAFLKEMQEVLKLPQDMSLYEVFHRLDDIGGMDLHEFITVYKMYTGQGEQVDICKKYLDSIRKKVLKLIAEEGSCTKT